ncbi:hypothetical protein D6T65_08965 [Arthrobacter frigidicola]|nr:hypothetical protein D6T65_08965 [Arthrobacter frigidicola]
MESDSRPPGTLCLGKGKCMLSRLRPTRGRTVRHLTPLALVLGSTVLAADLLLVAASVLRNYVDAGGAFGFLHRELFDGNKDRTLAELFGNLQLLVASVLLLWIAAAPARKAERFRDAAVYGAWALVLLAMSADDFFRIHEEVGRAIDTRLELPALFGLRSQDLGELLVWAGVAAALGAPLLIAHLISRGRPRRDSYVFIGLAVLLALFAVGMDMLHFILGDLLPSLALSAMNQLEIAGELGAMTLMMVWAVHIFTRPANPAGDDGWL